ncbi:hypothetical protein GCM10009715_22680 [Paeniglutamicibacter psychrophenolicus]|uniref:Uncharacterized protein n=1 Tax=Paeniglutamicibacter psychrophenolicus TaxID=257454 RepID=A0ABS4WHM8_9MICC|nr:hypothetical protein [Paeniglutamicibacter psychrophenolicus]MBP2375703.1 hypothetical protein [Paeniglutamicibacter psychrophenolicus]
MGNKKPQGITGPISMAHSLKQSVESGAYERDEAIESWLGTDAAAAYDDLCADPSQAPSSGQIRARLADIHAQRLAEGGWMWRSVLKAKSTAMSQRTTSPHWRTPDEFLPPCPCRGVAERRPVCVYIRAL